MTTTTSEARRGSKALLRPMPGVLALAALTVTACAPNEDPAEFEDAEAAGQTEEENAESEPPGEDQSNNDSEAEDEASDNDTDAAEDDDAASPSSAEDVSLELNDALQTHTYAISHEEGEVEGDITVGLHSVTVEADTMLLQLSFTPEYEEPEDGPVQFNALHARGQNLGNAQWLRPIIADRENLNSHHVLEWGTAASHDAYWMTMLGYSGDGLFAPAGETLPFFAYFAAPQDPIEQVDVSLPEIGITFQSVELTGDVETDGQDSADQNDDGDDEDDA